MADLTLRQRQASPTAASTSSTASTSTSSRASSSSSSARRAAASRRCCACIAGLEEITARRRSQIDGEVVNDVPPSKRGIAMVFQSYALYPHMTVYDNMAFG